MSGMDAWQERENQRMREHVPGEDAISRLSREIERLKINHKDVVKTKHRTELRLRAALDGLQAIYTLCSARPENADPMTMVNVIHRLAGDAFERATMERIKGGLR